MALVPASAATGKNLTADMVRLANSALAPLTSGIISPADLAPRGLGQAGVGMDPGAAVIQNTYATSIVREAYLVASDGPTDDGTVEITAAGSGSQKVDYVIARIEDSNFAGQAENPLSWRFAVVATLAGIQYPYTLIAKVVQPAANTSGIQDEMITDLRKVANPRQLTVPFVRNSLGTDVGQTLTSTSDEGEYFPNLGSFDVDIPEWATRVIITNATWYGVQIPDGNNVWGTRWVEFGRTTGTHSREKKTQEIRFDSIGKGGNSREDWGAAGDASIPKAIRGTTQPFGFHAKYAPNSTDKGVHMDGLSGVSMMLTFQEVADSNIERNP